MRPLIEQECVSHALARRTAHGSWLAALSLHYLARIDSDLTRRSPRRPSRRLRMSGSVLVTGGAGFIGSHIAEAFLGAGWSVTCLDDLSRGKRQQVPAAARFIEADVRSPDAFGAMADGKLDVLIHEAAQIDVRVSVERAGARCVDQPGRFREPPLSRRRRPGEAGHLRVERRRRVRRPGGATDTRADCQPANFAIRREQARRRALPPGARRRSTVSRVSRCDTPTYTVRGRTRQSEAGVVSIFVSRLLGRQAADHFRRRHADPRLRVREGRCSRQPSRRPALLCLAETGSTSPPSTSPRDAKPR